MPYKIVKELKAFVLVWNSWMDTHRERFSTEIEGEKYDYEVDDLHEITRIIESSIL
jgi:hypothetical protein